MSNLKKKLLLKQDASLKMIVFLILTTCTLKLVVERLREVRDSSVCNRMVTVLNNFFPQPCVSPMTLGYGLETGHSERSKI